jgi:phycocyanobilin lyase beta subunit
MTDSASPDVTALIQAVDEADSPDRLVQAVQALAAAQAEAGIPTLIQALGFNNPGAAMMAVRGLVQCGQTAVPALLSQIDGYNYGARSYAIRALAAIADPRALDILQQSALTDFAPSVRRAAAKGLGQVNWADCPDPVAAQAQVLDTLVKMTCDADWSIRYAAIVGLDGLSHAVTDAEVQHQVQDQLRHFGNADRDAGVRARAQAALVPEPLASR